jgi:hypothetical protein
MKARCLWSVLAAFALPLTATTVHAANTTCANADYIFPGERAQYGAAASSSLFFKSRVTAGRSYAVMTWGPFQDAGEGGVALSLNLFSDSTCSASPGGADAGDYEPFLFGIPGHSADHDNVIPTADGTVYIQVTNTVAVGYTVHTLFIETTLFSPWWFAGGTNNAFAEVRNNMTGSTTAHMTFYSRTGAVCGTINAVIPGNGNTAVNIGAVGTCAAAVSGSAQIAFAGTPGGLVANITTIDGVNGTSFDAPFTPRMVWSTFSR